MKRGVGIDGLRCANPSYGVDSSRSTFGGARGDVPLRRAGGCAQLDLMGYATLTYPTGWIRVDQPLEGHVATCPYGGRGVCAQLDLMGYATLTHPTG